MQARGTQAGLSASIFLSVTPGADIDQRPAARLGGNSSALMGEAPPGEGRALVRGEPGVGKTVLLDYLAGRASG